MAGTGTGAGATGAGATETAPLVDEGTAGTEAASAGDVLGLTRNFSRNTFLNTVYRTALQLIS